MRFTVKTFPTFKTFKTKKYLKFEFIPSENSVDIREKYVIQTFILIKIIK